MTARERLEFHDGYSGRFKHDLKPLLLIVFVLRIIAILMERFGGVDGKS